MKKILLAATVFAAMFSSCGGNGESAPAQANPDTLQTDTVQGSAIIPTLEMLDGKWNIKMLKDEMIEPLDTNLRMTFNVADTLMGAFAGCNSIGGKISRMGRSVDFLAFDNVALTQMMCPEMTKEQKLVEAINSVRKFSFSDENTLILSNEEDVCVLQLVK